MRSLGGIAAAPGRLLVQTLKLPLGDIAVIALQLLLGGKLLAVVGRLAALAAVLAGRIIPPHDRVLGPAPQVDAEAATDLVLRLDALGHVLDVVSCGCWEPRRYSDAAGDVKAFGC